MLLSLLTWKEYALLVAILFNVATAQICPAILLEKELTSDDTNFGVRNSDYYSIINERKIIGYVSPKNLRRKNQAISQLRFCRSVSSLVSGYSIHFNELNLLTRRNTTSKRNERENNWE